MTLESQNIEWKRSWRDEHLKCICGFANGRGGVLEIGRNDRGEVVGVADVLRLLEEIPNRVQSLFGIVVNVYQRSDCGHDYLRIVVPPHPAQVSYRREFPYPAADMPPDVRVRPGNSTRKQPENPDQPENRQKISDRIVALLRERPAASRREIVAALGNTTEGSVRYQLDKLKASGRLRRVGADRGGHWMVVDGHDAEGNRRDRRLRWRPPVARRDTVGPRPANDQKTARKPPENRQKRPPTAGTPCHLPSASSLSSARTPPRAAAKSPPLSELPSPPSDTGWTNCGRPERSHGSVPTRVVTGRCWATPSASPISAPTATVGAPDDDRRRA